MEYSRLGNTGLEVSKLCIGCMGFGDPKNWVLNWVLEEDDSRKIIKKALDSGINFFDTANCYSLGISEEILGRALKDYAKREDVVIATKVFFKMREGPNGSGLSRKEIMHEVNQSLKRLGVDYVDILYIHRWDYNTPIEETMCALNDLVRSGKVMYLGASAMYAWQFQKAQYVAEKNGWTKFSVMQNHYNLIYREEEREMIPLCKDMGVALVTYSPLASGRLARNYSADTKRFHDDANAKDKYGSTEEEDMKIVVRVGEIAKKYNATHAQISLAWLWAKGVTAPIVGANKEEYIDEYIGAFKIKLTDEDIKYLEELYVPHKVVGAL
jgi:aryl-alcohol dehydrogenase-like predicted oxidoreductase